MESQVSPKNIESRVEAMAAAEAKAEPKVEEPKVEPKVEAKAEPKVEEPKVDVKAEPKVEKPEPKVEKEKKQPNDPAELRKWSTKLSQENATLRDEMKAIKAAIEKMSKKPVDYAALAKDPDGLKRHIEEERQEAVRELQEKYVEARDRAVANETRLIRAEMEKDADNYPRFTKLFPLIQNLAGNQDGRINFNKQPREVLHDLYELAETLSPVEIAAAPVPVAVAPVAPVAPAVTEEQIQARVTAAVEAAVAKAKADAEAGIRAENNGAGIGSAGKGGRRDNKLSKEAYAKMDRQELKKLISQE